MSYISPESISRAIWRLHSDVHPFVGITFLACKKARLPVGMETQISVDDLTRAHLDEVHLFPEISQFYFQPFKSIKFWVNRKYPSAGLQAINTQTFDEVLKHEKGSSTWNFSSNYIVALESKLKSLRYRKKPRILDLAIWLYKSEKIEEYVTAQALIDKFIEEFNLTDDELDTIFDKSADDASKLLLVADRPHPSEYLKFFDTAPDAPSDVGGTLEELVLNSVGPVDELGINLGDRITLITGDNGLGKSFLLECAWWAATGEWVHNAAYPGISRKNEGYEPSIDFTIRESSGFSRSTSAAFNWRSENWIEPDERTRLRALGVYSAADGSFSIYDPSQPQGRGKRRHAITLSQNDVWSGSKDIEGIVRDWTKWQKAEDQTPFSTLISLIERLSPEDLGLLKPGGNVRVPNDRRDIPTLQHPYGTTPIIFASAGVKRILALAYLITWCLHEHHLSAAQKEEAVLDHLFIIIDEIESHLHPKWQRTILPALLQTLEGIADGTKTQIIVATHSPLVLSSMEVHYSSEVDRSYHFSLTDGQVRLEELQFSKQGDVSQWLTSPFLGLNYARSKAAESAIAEAISIQEEDEPSQSAIEFVNAKLKATLASTDKFWPRWTYFASRHGVT